MVLDAWFFFSPTPLPTPPGVGNGWGNGVDSGVGNKWKMEWVINEVESVINGKVEWVINEVEWVINWIFFKCGVGNGVGIKKSQLKSLHYHI